jgi:hypothetical protein
VQAPCKPDLFWPYLVDRIAAEIPLLAAKYTRKYLVRRQLTGLVTAAILGAAGYSVASQGPVLAQVPALASSSQEQAAPDPRIGYYVSETENLGFVLDRSGEKGLLRFDQSLEIHVLDMVPGPQGVTYLKNGLGVTILRLMPWGGATVYDADGAEGGAFGFREGAKPLNLEPASRDSVERRSAEIERKLSTDLKLTFAILLEPSSQANDTSDTRITGVDVSITRTRSKTVSSLMESPATGLMSGAAPAFQSQGAGLSADLSTDSGAERLRPASLPETWKTMGDALELATLALERLASDELAHEVMAERIDRVVIKVGSEQAISLAGRDLVVTCVPERGLLGRPSSAEIERFLLENL